MMNWKTTTNRKKIQRHINKVLREMNKSIEQDSLWLGRFYCHQIDIAFFPSDDHSYTYCHVGVEFVDRKTGFSEMYAFHKEDFMWNGYRVWEAMNNFIVHDCDVWSGNPRLSIK